MRNRVVTLGLDACDSYLALSLVKRGEMPNLARLLEEGSRCRVENPFALFVGAIWANYATALRPSKHGFHCWDKIEPSTYQRELSPPRISHLPSFWKRISDAGRSVAAIDVPHRLANEPLNGLEVSEWGTHDRHHGLVSQPADLALELERKYAFHPVFGIEPKTALDFAPDDQFERQGPRRTAQEDEALFHALLQGVDIKRRITLDVMRRGDWDFFVSIFGESHAAGHQLWHLHDPTHPRFDQQARDALGGDPVAQVYSALDQAIGEVMAELGDDCLLLVHLSHGMNVHYDCTHMLEEILIRLDGHGRTPARTRTGAWLKRAAAPLVAPLRRVAHAVRIPASLRGRVGQRLQVSEHSTPESRARRRYFLEPNNSVYGGVRLNLIGREPRGCVQPAEVDAICAQLETDLLDIRDSETGRPVVRAVVRCDSYHERRPDDVMPDLLVEWTRDSQTSGVTSPKIGSLHAPYEGWRSGDHRPNGLLVARGRGVPAGGEMPAMATEDIGPTIAAYLGVTLDGVDGKPAAWLAQATVS
jgi:predicted AlkP superfamily phosphohydrolase/phosphomutase